MPVPNPRTPICIARGNTADLTANIAALQEGEVCYSFDEDAIYVKESGVLVKAGGAGVASVSGTAPIQVNSANPAQPIISVAPATTSTNGVVRWADTAQIAAGTPGRAVDAFQLKQVTMPNGQQLLDLLQWNGSKWIADRRIDGGNF